VTSWCARHTVTPPPYTVTAKLYCTILSRLFSLNCVIPNTRKVRLCITRDACTLFHQPIITVWNGIDIPCIETPCTVLFANVLRYWLVTSTVQCILLHHKTSGLEGMASDILTLLISVKPPFHQHWNDISTHSIYGINGLFSVWNSDWCVFICTFTNLNTHTCDQNKLMSNIFLFYLLLLMNISFVSLTCISHCKVRFSKKSFSCC
jgi:hypothetical protein